MGRLDVRICEARNLPDTQLIGKPDPYVVIKLEQQKHKTSTQENQINPKWEEVFKFNVADADSSQIKFELWNKNLVSDDFLGQYTLSLSGLERGVVRDKWYLLQQCKSNSELRIRVMALDFGKLPADAPTDPQNVAGPIPTHAPQASQSPQPPVAAPPQASYPPQQAPPPASYPQQQPPAGYPPQPPPAAYPPQPSYPPQQPGYPPQQPGYPPQQPGYPPQQPGYPPQQPGYPPQQPGYPPQQPGYPPQQPGYPPQQPGYPPQQPGYPPAPAPGYPPQPPQQQVAQGFPPQQPGFGY